MSDIEEKKALYQSILESTDEELLLERMRALGFWPEDEELPQDPPAEAKEAIELKYEIDKLRRKGAVAGDPEEALKKERVRRWNESKHRRAKNRIARELAQKERREKWEAEKADKLVCAGEGVSAGLSGSTVSTYRFGVPELATPAELANALELSIGQLRWLTYHRRAAALVHYQRYEVPKKTGGRRPISAPKPLLKRAQAWILEHILDKAPVEPQAHGFVGARSVKSNAAPHVGRRIVINLDLEDFFPSIGFRRVKGVFHRVFGYPEPVAVAMALLCTEPPRAPVELDGKVFHVALASRALPQGACTSPALTNIVCRVLDRRLSSLADKIGFQYTRYADDLTFSGDDPKKVHGLLGTVRRVVSDEGLRVNEAKTRVMHRGRRQEVTGVVVNAGLSISRRERRELRAILHNAARHGLASQNRDGHPKFYEHLRGRLAWLKMISPEQAAPLIARFEQLPRP